MEDGIRPDVGGGPGGEPWGGPGQRQAEVGQAEPAKSGGHGRGPSRSLELDVFGSHGPPCS